MLNTQFKLVKEFTDKSLGFTEKKNTLPLRRAARTVVFDEEERVALMHSKEGHLKLPGGGLDSGEDAKTAAKRETLEETGRQFKIVEPVCITIEYKTHGPLVQISYAFVGHTFGVPKKPQLSKAEKAEGFHAEWYTPITAIRLLKKQTRKRKSYNGKFMSNRDLFILRTALEVLKR